jgi:hypothetical protein
LFSQPAAEYRQIVSQEPTHAYGGVRMHKEYRQEWAMAGYHETMGSAAVVRPPAVEFRRLYHITTADYAVSDISHRRLKIARVSDLNDPFEMMAISLRETRHRNTVASLRQSFNAKNGVLCFSSDWLNPVLWSHYGAKHCGICLGFNVRRSQAEPVTYVSKRVLRDLPDVRDLAELDGELQQILRCTKYASWSYEQEWRIFMPLDQAHKEGDLYFHPFNEDLQLAEVILGQRCERSLDEVRELTKSMSPTVSCIESRLAVKFFSIVPEESSVP